MAELPIGAELLYNSISKAPGFRVENVYALPGVPKIMQAIFETFAHTLVGGQPMLSRSISTHIGEGVIGTDLERLQSKFREVEIGSYPFSIDGKTGTSLVARHTDRKLLDIVVKEFKLMIKYHGEEITET